MFSKCYKLNYIIISLAITMLSSFPNLGPCSDYNPISKSAANNKNISQYKWQNVGNAIPNINIDNLCITIDNNNTPYIEFNNQKNNDEMTVMKYDGTKWIKLGKTNIYGFRGERTMVTDSKGIPYIIGGNVVEKYNGVKWITVGNKPFTDEIISQSSINIDNEDNLYIAFMYNNVVTIMKYNGSKWITVGNEGVEHASTSIVINKQETPYILIPRDDNFSATVMKYNGTNWVVVGGSSFSYGGGIIGQSLEIDSKGTPYIAFTDYVGSHVWSDERKPNVMKYNGSKWVVAGNADFGNHGDYMSMAIDRNDIPYVIYSDYRAVVMRLINNTWTVVGEPHISDGNAHYTSIAIDNKGTPYVAFLDISIYSKGSKLVIKKFAPIK